jgi:phage terminase large subunit-like protein
MAARTTACPDWDRRIAVGESLIPQGPLFPQEAEAAMAVFDSLRVVEATGSPTFGEASRHWVRDFASNVFGALDPQTGERAINEFFLLIAKKNGKSTLAAGVMLTALLLNWRVAAEFYILAPTKEIADTAFKSAREMVKADAELGGDDGLIRIKAAVRELHHKRTGAVLKVIAADADTVGGKKGVGIFVDELWLFGKRANAHNLLSEATGGLASYPEGFVIYASTQSDEPPAGVFKEKLEFYRRIRDGDIVAPHALPVLYEYPPALQKAKAWEDPATWAIPNPNLDLSVSRGFIAGKLAEAREAGAHAENVILAKHLNVEIGQQLRADRWAGADVWAAAVDPTLTLETLISRSEVVVAGIDGGGLDDLLGLSLIGRERGSGRWLAWGRAYAHVSVLRRRKSIASQLIDFATAGELEVFDSTARLDPSQLAALIDDPSTSSGQTTGSGQAPGADLAPRPEAPPAFRQAVGGLEGRPDDDPPVLVPPDIQALVDVVARPLAAGVLAIVGIDTHGVGLIVEGLKTIGVQESEDGRLAPLIGVSQGYKLHGAIKTAERKLDDRTLLHADQRLTAWSVGNARTVLSGNAAMVTKAASGTAKIDPLMALFNAVALMSQNPEPAGSVYSANRGLRSFG